MREQSASSSDTCGGGIRTTVDGLIFNRLPSGQTHSDLVSSNQPGMLAVAANTVDHDSEVEEVHSEGTDNGESAHADSVATACGLSSSSTSPQVTSEWRAYDLFGSSQGCQRAREKGCVRRALSPLRSYGTARGSPPLRSRSDAYALAYLGGNPRSC